MSSEKEFKDRHREDLSRSRFVNAKQRESRAPPDRRATNSRRSTAMGVSNASAFTGLCRKVS
jgi:hypothetical protein